jgi:hypothetical protein
MANKRQVSHYARFSLRFPDIKRKEEGGRRRKSVAYGIIKQVRAMHNNQDLGITVYNKSKKDKPSSEVEESRTHFHNWGLGELG